MKKTLYDILSVEADATPEQIRAAYQRATAELDNEGQHDPNKKVILREAFELLLHPQKRASYDARLARQNNLPAQAITNQDKQAVAAPVANPSKPKNWFAPVILGILLLAAVATWWSVKQKEERNKLRDNPVASEVMPAPATINMPAPAPQAITISANTEAGKTAEEIYALRSPSIALISVFSPTGVQVAIGSGVMIEQQVLITNCHVTRNGVQYKAKIGQEFLAATVIMADEEFDLCRLSVPGSTAPAVELGSTDNLRIGQKVFAIGAPQGLDLTISDGIVSSLRTLASGKVIQTTAPISPGSSGGGLFDNAGKLVGIMTFQHRLGQNLNFAVPADWIRTMSSRSATNQSVGALTMSSIDGNSNSNSNRSDNNQQASSAQQANAKVLGNWLCYGVLTGYSMDLLFNKNAQMTGAMNGKKFSGTYYFDGKSLTLSGGGSFSGVVEELSDYKMVINAGKAARLVCNKK
ncbi:trypsin-like peptidase domain-containing protein [Undibacterium sp. Ji83W]|uniref:trypsin-like peptidase domain-containing protein n=1 Tax=Undibacterium sp. Ji83W TaxID=3413043 RepID=UPI003BF2ECF3